MAEVFEFIEAAAMNDAEVALAVQQRQIHVLIDMSGWTLFPGMELLAMRPAPLVMHFHGYPGTMGAPFVDYLASDKITSPPDLISYYSEVAHAVFRSYLSQKLIYLADTYLVTDYRQSRREVLLQRGEPLVNRTDGSPMAWPTRAEFGIPDDAIVFGAWNVRK